jgi:succinate dehydrogenase / fumarate reductase, cytochrome b subunit
MGSRGRPLSPHLLIYRWPITMVMSVLHRATGVVLSVGFIVLSTWLLSAADGAGSYDRFAELVQSAGGRVLLALLTFAFFLHLGSGLRHLVWDLGYGFEIPQANAGSWAVIAAACSLTILYWLIL